MVHYNYVRSTLCSVIHHMYLTLYILVIIMSLNVLLLLFLFIRVFHLVTSQTGRRLADHVTLIWLDTEYDSHTFIESFYYKKTRIYLFILLFLLLSSNTASIFVYQPPTNIRKKFNLDRDHPFCYSSSIYLVLCFF